jgi:hypothetical protein
MADWRDFFFWWLASLAGATMAAALAVPHHLQLRAHRRTGASR